MRLALALACAAERPALAPPDPTSAPTSTSTPQPPLAPSAWAPALPLHGVPIPLPVPLPRTPMTGAAFAGCTLDPSWPRPSGSLDAVFVDTTLAPHAVCNDGSPGVYYIRPGSNQWILYLDGGSHCANHADCITRYCDGPNSYGLSDMSSSTASPTMSVGGLLSPVPINPFSGWTVVYVHYCSSDVWTGAVGEPVVLQDTGTEGTDDDYTIRFEGRTILDAVISELLAPERRPELAGLPDPTQMETLLFTGSSAGGLGATQAADDVRERFEAAAPLVDVRLLTVGATSPGIQGALDPWGPVSSPAMMSHVQEKMGLGARGQETFGPGKYAAHLDASCLALHPYDSWWCADIAHVLTHDLATPFFLVQDQLDIVWMTGVDDDVDGGDGPDAGEVNRTTFAHHERAFMASLQTIQDPAVPSVYPEDAPAPGGVSPRCEAHDGYGRVTTMFGAWKFTAIGEAPGVTASIASLLKSWITGIGPTRGWTGPDEVPDCADTGLAP